MRPCLLPQFGFYTVKRAALSCCEVKKIFFCDVVEDKRTAQFRFTISETSAETYRFCSCSVIAVDYLAETWRRVDTMFISDIKELVF
jgi:hypothetical protein